MCPLASDDSASVGWHGTGDRKGAGRRRRSGEPPHEYGWSLCRHGPSRTPVAAAQVMGSGEWGGQEAELES